MTISPSTSSPFQKVAAWAQSDAGKAKIQTAAIIVGIALTAIALVAVAFLAAHGFDIHATGHAIVHLAKSGWEMFAPALPLKMAMRN